MIDIGLDIYQTVQPEIYDLSKLKTDYGKDLTFWGAISTQKTLPFVGPNELKDIVKQTINIMGVNGGYIAAPTHKVPQDVPVENIIALIEVLKEQ
jgi:uroporphyrinogen decarboxylase